LRDNRQAAVGGEALFKFLHLLGALFVVTLPPLRKEEPLPPAPQPTRPATPAAPAARPQISTIEAVFSAWGDNAVWDNNITEVALWNTDTAKFSDYYEVRRIDGNLYFRTIPKLTRRIVSHGKPLPVEAPLQFTESEAQYLEWLEHGRTERRPEPSAQSKNR
jgi:hypothetical protein